MINSNGSGYLKKLHRIYFSTYNQIVKHPRQKEHVAVVLSSSGGSLLRFCQWLIAVLLLPLHVSLPIHLYVALYR
jgi:hypothetical protein